MVGHRGRAGAVDAHREVAQELSAALRPAGVIPPLAGTRPPRVGGTSRLLSVALAATAAANELPAVRVGADADPQKTTGCPFPAWRCSRRIAAASSGDSGPR